MLNWLKKLLGIEPEAAPVSKSEPPVLIDEVVAAQAPTPAAEVAPAAEVPAKKVRAKKPAQVKAEKKPAAASAKKPRAKKA